MKKLVAVIVLVVALVASVYFFRDRFVSKSVLQNLLVEKEQLQKKTETLESELDNLQSRLQSREEKPVNKALEKVLSGVQDNASQQQPLEQEDLSVDKKVKNYFLYLDQKGYLADFGINESSRDYFMDILGRLEKAKPVITGETSNLYTLMKNITYFYRVLGKQNLKVLKTIIDGEDELIEPAMALMFQWLNPWERPEGSGKSVVSPEVMYEYASFFLNTIAGQTYLFRRNAKIRDLVRYYSIIVIDYAGRHEMNRYGIDIRPQISLLIDDMQGNKLIENSDKYINKLQHIKSNYPG